MKLIVTMAVLLVTALSACAQDVQGYFITASGVKTEGYFKQVNFYNETQLYFKKNATDANYEKIDPETITGYGVADDVKFEKYTLQLDDTKIMGADPGNNKEAEWVTKTVFLNVILEGDASLYSYSSDKGTKYCFTVKSKNVPLSQLLYKQYMAKQNAIADNNQYRQQLFMNVSCTGQPASDFTNVSYNKKELVAIFEKYNACNGGEVKQFSATTSKKASFKFTLFAGAIFNTMEVSKVRPAPDNVGKTTPNFGAEMALTLPSEKISFFLRASYQSLSASTATVVSSEIRTTTDTYAVDSNLYNVTVGPRYNFMPSVNHTLFIDAGYGVSLANGDYTHYHKTVIDSGTVSGPPLSYSLAKAYFFSAGLGYTYDKHYGIDARYETAKEYLSDALPENIKVGSFSVNLRYTF